MIPQKNKQYDSGFLSTCNKVTYDIPQYFTQPMVKFQQHSHCYWKWKKYWRLPFATLLNQSDGVGITFKQNCFFSTRQNLVIIIVIWGGATKCVPVMVCSISAKIWVLIVLFKNTIEWVWNRNLYFVENYGKSSLGKQKSCT